EGEGGGHLLARRLVVHRRLGQEQAGLQVGEPSRHHEIVGGDLEAQAPRLGDEGEILVGELQDRDLREVDLLLAREVEKNVDRPLVGAEIEEEVALARIAHRWPVTKRTRSMMTSTGQESTQPMMLRLIPSCAPMNGRRKMSARRISKPCRSSLASGNASASGRRPTATRPPSSGGSGIMLKTARTTLMRIAFSMFCSAQGATELGR